MTSSDHQFSLNQWPTRTLGVAAVVVVVYCGQLIAAGSLDPTAAYRVATEFQGSIGAGTVVFSWLLHSSHTHILGNLCVFLVAGWWVETRIDGDRYLLGVAIGLGIGANVAALVVFSEGGLGLSCVTAGLVAMVALGAFQWLSEHSRVDWLVIVLAVGAVLWLSVSVGVLGGLSPGTAVWVHRFGVVFGVVWYVVERGRYGFQKSS